MSDIAIKVENLKKQYRLGTISGGTLSSDLQSWWARKRGKEDPNVLIGMDQTRIGEMFYALDGVNFEVKKGEAVGIIGSNGAGKSTLLKLLSRVTAPTEGKIGINGRIASMLEVGTGFHPELTGRENIYMNGAILGMTKAEIDVKLEDIIDFSECRQFIDTPVKRYSSGMYVKLAFAVAAHLDAEIMIMDEVLAVGDIKFQEKCLGKMGDASENEGKTVLYVSHNMNTIRQLCSRCIVMNQGKIIYDGDVETAIEIYVDEEKRDLMSLYDLRRTDRPSLDHGKQVHVESFEFIGKERAQFMNDEKLRCRMKLKTNNNVDGLRLYLAIKNADSTVVGSIISEPFADAKPGLSIEYEFEMDFSNLVPGVYFFLINVINMNSIGAASSYDRPEQGIFFELLPKYEGATMEWKRRFMGSVRLKEIKSISIK